MSEGLPLELLHDCLIPEKDHLHFASKTPLSLSLSLPAPPDHGAKKILADQTELGRRYFSTHKCHKFNQTHSHLQHRSDL